MFNIWFLTILKLEAVYANMNLLVCFKIVRDLENVIESDWEMAKDGSFEINYTRKIWNCFDEAALQTALCIKNELEKSEESCRLTALTISKEKDSIDTFAESLYALHYSKVVQIIDARADLYSDPVYIAGLIADYIQQGDRYDAILMGYQSSPYDNAQTPLLTAEMLGIPCIGMVWDIVPEGGGFKTVAQIEGGTRSFYVNSPAIYMLANAKHTYLGVPTLREKLRAKHNKTIQIDANVLKFRLGNHLCLSELYKEQNQRNCVMIDGTNEQKAEILFEKYIKTAVKNENGTGYCRL